MAHQHDDHNDHSLRDQPPTDWKHDGVRVVPGDQLDGNVPSTPGMDRKAAINFARVGAQKLWAGTVHIHPNAKTGAHHHGPLESVIYVVKGRARMRWGNALEFTAETRRQWPSLVPIMTALVAGHQKMSSQNPSCPAKPRCQFNRHNPGSPGRSPA